MTPDWSDSPEPIPYADMADPQSLNLYPYVGNNPTVEVDADGHWLGVTNQCILCFFACLPSDRSGLNLDTLRQLADQANNAAHQAYDWYRTSQVDKGCLAAATVAGAAFGASKGPVVGGVLGLAGGPAAEVTVPGGAAAGAILGAAGGAAAGNLVGQIACRTGGAGSGGGGSKGKQGTFWKSLKSYRQNIKTDGERLYQWDYTHGDVEVYNNRGEHLGSADAETGQMTKPAVPGRFLNL